MWTPFDWNHITFILFHCTLYPLNSTIVMTFFGTYTTQNLLCVQYICIHRNTCCTRAFDILTTINNKAPSRSLNTDTMLHMYNRHMIPPCFIRFIAVGFVLTTFIHIQMPVYLILWPNPLTHDPKSINVSTMASLASRRLSEPLLPWFSVPSDDSNRD